MTIRLAKHGLAVLLLVGCATIPSVRASKIKEADAAMVQHCTFLGNVDGSSGWGNVAASTGVRNAKNEALEKAAALGATHIVWIGVAGGYSPFVSGSAYECK